MVCLEESGDGHGEAVHVEHGQQQQPVLPCTKFFLSKFLQFKETASQDFRLQVFLHDHLPPGPDNMYLLGPFEVFRKFAKIFAAEGAPPVSSTQATKLPPASIAPAANVPLVW
jgi:hypothetical protein